MSNTRPRITFDEEGVCNACRYSEEKFNKINWKAKWKKLEAFCNRYRAKDGSYDCIIPVSGGKDGSYVAWRMKHDLRMHPLCVTWQGNGLATDIGRKNLENFVNSGFDLIAVIPNGRVYRKLTKKGFVEFGDPFLPFIFGQMAAPVRIAINYGIKLVVYGEDPEIEYGGSIKTKNLPVFDGEYVRKFLYSEQNVDKYIDKEISLNDLKPFMFPSEKEIESKGIKLIHFSHFDLWDPYKNYELAKEKCGFRARKNRSEGTFTNYASLDDKLDGFHYYLMWMKFGICRATSDAGHLIREGRLTREVAIKLVKKYDGEFPKKYFKFFLDYIGLTEKEFWKVIEKWRNRNIFEKVNGKWRVKNPIWKQQCENEDKNKNRK